jgi:hypothetical protein
MLTPVDVLARISPPIGGFGASREVGSVSGSSFSDSLKSPLFRENHKGSSRENRLVAVGEARLVGLNGLESTVSRRRVLGRTADDGELTPKVVPGA